MPKCVLCDSQAFDILDGLYFCIQCGTQSQDICEEEVEDTYVNEPSRPNIRKERKGKRPKKFKEKDLGRPWFTLEGFQILLKAQIEYLLKIGVDPKLKDVVGQMWFRYIQLSTDVFLPTVHGESKNLDGSQYVRPLKKSRDNIKDFIPTNSIYRPLPKSKEDKQEELDALELSSEIAREDFYEDDDPTGALFDSDSDNGDNDNDNVQDSDISCCGSTAVRFHKTHNGVSYMTLSHTLAFCYLGLLWLKEPICISDLLRWAREGHLPYLNAFSYFPSYMKFSQADTRTFSPHATLYKKKVYTSATALKTFLRLPDIPKHDIKLYIARYATDLHLPGFSLSGSILATHQVSSAFHCAMECMEHSRCKSYNYQHQTSTQSHQCELLDKTKATGTFNPRSGYTHYETQKPPCEGIECKNGATCVPDCLTGKATCACSLSFDGRYCEVGVPPHVEIPPKSQGVIPDQTAIINCYSSRAETYIWYKDNTVLDTFSTERISMFPNGSLQIKVFTNAENGAYHCYVSNAYSSEVSVTATIEVLSSCDNPQALGMHTGKIPDAAITATSVWTSDFLPKYARLNTHDSTGCAWLRANADSTQPWLQVDFGKDVVVTGVATQGSCTYSEWTKTYVIWYSNNGANWTYYKESNTAKIFTGNTDQNTVVTNYFQPPITARYVRISPKSWYRYADLRIEYYGCR